MFLSLYRIRVKTRRWYLKIFWHCVDIAKVNAWLLYRRHCTILKVPKRKEMSLLKFSCEVAEGLIFQNKVVQPVATPGRPAKRKRLEAETSTKPGRKPTIPLPSESYQFDQLGHWPEPQSKRRRCRHCKNGYSQVYCSKCKVCLCLRNGSNCFEEFHVN
jgi:hypothetical protein